MKIAEQVFDLQMRLGRAEADTEEAIEKIIDFEDASFHWYERDAHIERAPYAAPMTMEQARSILDLGFIRILDHRGSKKSEFVRMPDGHVLGATEIRKS